MACGSYGYTSLSILHTFRLPVGRGRRGAYQSQIEGVKLQAKLSGKYLLPFPQLWPCPLAPSQPSAVPALGNWLHEARTEESAVLRASEPPCQAAGMPEPEAPRHLGRAYLPITPRSFLSCRTALCPLHLPAPDTGLTQSEDTADVGQSSEGA